MPALPRPIQKLVQRYARKLFTLEAEQPLVLRHVLDGRECVAPAGHRN